MHFADFHCDTVGVLYEQPKRLETLQKNHLQLDAQRLHEIGAMLQHFALFIDMKKYQNPYATTLDMLDYYDTQLALCKNYIQPATNTADIFTAIRQGKTAAILTIEEGGILDGDLSRLDTLYLRGVRLLTLTWNYANCIDDRHGLTAFGKQVTERCEQLRIVVDVSHLSDQGFYDVYDMCSRPFVASHSNARSICPHARNLTDDMIQKLANRGGKIGINFCPAFTEGVTSPSPYGTINSIVRHIRHIYRIGGIACLCIGSDFDGIDRHLELDHVGMMPLLFDALKKDGFAESEIDAIFYKNMLTFYREVLTTP